MALGVAVDRIPGPKIFSVKVGTVIRTTYADTELIRKHLPSLHGQPDEDRLLRAAAILDDLGITVTDTHAEANEIREKIPAHLLYASKEVGGWHLFVHARVEALPLRERW
jgi:hypothetical protein